MLVRLYSKHFSPKFKKLCQSYGDQSRAGKFSERLVRYKMYMWRFVVGRRSCPIIFNDFFRHQVEVEENALYKEKKGLCTVRASQTRGKFREHFLSFS